MKSIGVPKWIRDSWKDAGKRRLLRGGVSRVSLDTSINSLSNTSELTMGKAWNNVEEFDKAYIDSMTEEQSEHFRAQPAKIKRRKRGNTHNLGEVGYVFRKQFNVGWFTGEVIEIIDDPEYVGLDRRCLYSDGDLEDLRLEDLKHLAQLEAQLEPNTMSNFSKPPSESEMGKAESNFALAKRAAHFESDGDTRVKDSGKKAKLITQMDECMDDEKEIVVLGLENNKTGEDKSPDTKDEKRLEDWFLQAKANKFVQVSSYDNIATLERYPNVISIDVDANNGIKIAGKRKPDAEVKVALRAITQTQQYSQSLSVGKSVGVDTDDTKLSTGEVIKYRKMLAYCFDLAKCEHIHGGIVLKDVCITVESENVFCGFNLQKLFDSMYDLNNRKKQVNGATRFSQVLFTNNSTKGLLCQWKVTYKKQEKYGSDKGNFFILYRISFCK